MQVLVKKRVLNIIKQAQQFRKLPLFIKAPILPNCQAIKKMQKLFCSTCINIMNGNTSS